MTTLLTKLALANCPANQTVHIELSYRMGGTNFSTYKQQPRGYYLSAQVKTIEVSDGCITTKFSPMNGVCRCIEETKRFNQNRFDALALKVKADPFLYAPLVEQTLATEELELALQPLPQPAPVADAVALPA